MPLQTALLVAKSCSHGCRVMVPYTSFFFRCTVLEVSDNGCGIQPEDYEMLAQKHTTSKLRAFDDLTQLNTVHSEKTPVFFP